MRKGSAFWKSDWFAGVVISLVLAAAAGTTLVGSLETFAYDIGMKASSKTPGDKVAVIAIDDQSIANIGRWPWPRTYLADMVSALQKGGARVVGVPIFLSEPQIDPGLKYINDIDQFYAANIAASGPTTPAIAALGQQLNDARQALDTDHKLAASFKSAGNVVLPMEFELGEMQGHADKPLPLYVTRNQVTQINDPGNTAAGNGDLPAETSRAVPPIAELGDNAAYIGHLALNADDDGSYRRELLLVRYDGAFYPSLALMIAAKSLNLGVNDIKVDLGSGLRLGKLAIKTDAQMRMQTYYYSDVGGKPAFPVDSFYDIASGKIPLEKYKDKIVIIGPTAYGVGASLPTPVSASTEPVMVLAHTVSSILNQNFFVTPSWGIWLRIALFLLAAAYVIAGLPRLKAGPAAGASAAFVVVLLATHFVLMTGSGIWVPMVLPAALVVVGHVLITTKRFLITEKAKDKSEAQSADSNRMLGIALQQQGQLDMALEKFRKCPMDESMMDVLYNLALDYERKRQFNKAVSVYQYMSDYDPEFRDLKQKVARAQKLEETVILGGASMSSAAATLIMDPNSTEKPMLGRYQVEKELGKGAMGVVYLGRDPKINRVVAIKTMALKDEFEADELKDVKERFFREAETAGRLNHPNIVTIYDAGEEHDLAYIAMEFLHGHDLARYVKPDALLPVPKVVQIVFKAAVALNYAHQHNVVHRDIKPANIMYEPESGALKITDFGIARITDSSKTKTGTVLGTPTYMSPEQVAGKKVDGRSDLYSLGVMFYQMLSGVAPFRADSMASLMYKIANDPAPSLLEARPELAQQMPCLAGIIDKALAKDADNRYQTGQEFALAIKACVDSVTKKKTA
jgi:serine/threonine-protein kinase